MELQQLLDVYIYPWSIRIGLSLAIFILGRMVAQLLASAARKVMGKAGFDTLLVDFLGSIIYAVLLVMVVLSSLEQLGVNTTSALAVLGAAGLAVGLALKDSLANFASGVMLIIFRPFKVGDFIEAGGTSGVVEEIQIINTVFRTGDNRTVIVPNSKIYDGVIVNISARKTRRIDLVMTVGYDDDLKKVRQIMMGIMEADERILKDPEPAILLADLADSSINFNVRPWVNSSDYGIVRSDLLEAFKTAFDRQGVSIPYPQRDVHLHQTGSS